MSDFYENIERLDELIGRTNLGGADCTELLEIIRGDEDLSVYFYRHNSNPVWVKILRESGEFDKLGGGDEKVGVSEKSQARYLANVAEESPEGVLEVFTDIEKLHPFVRGDFVDALLKMPVEIAVKGVGKVLEYLRGKERRAWYFIGRSAGELMVRLAGDYPEEAFAIAEELLEVWAPEGEEVRSREIEGKFRPFEYEKILLESYSRLSEVYAYRSVELLIKILDGYIEEVQSGMDYEATTLWYIPYERLDQVVEKSGRDILASLIGALCEAGKKVIELQGDRAGKLLDILEERGIEIYRRIEMYLLRFVPAGTEKDRIDKIIGEKEYREVTGYKYEYYLLFSDKFDDVSDGTTKGFLEWIEERQVPDDEIENFAEWFKEVRGRDYEKNDLLKYEDSLRARKLSLVKERFKKEYGKYRDSSERSDAELAPQPMVGPARFVDPTEGTPLSIDEMSKMKAGEVVSYILDEDRWKDKKSTSHFRTAEEALSSAFEKAVRERVGEYIEIGSQELKKLKPVFMASYFAGIRAGLAQTQEDEIRWESILEFAEIIVAEMGEDETYRYCFGSLLNLIEHKLSQEIASEYYESLWKTIEPLTRYQHNPDNIVRPEAEKDPHSECINCVQGEAFQLAIRFGLGCKKERPDYWEKTMSKQVRDVLDFVATKVSLPKVVCVFGVWFVQLHWMEERWVEKNLDLILNEKDVKRWDAVWGSYVTWGRPAPKAFDFLMKRGKYKNAIQRIGEKNSFAYRKDVEEGLAEQLMIAYFNGWVEFDNEVLQSFFCKAPAKLRGYAASFLTTGFKDIKERKETEEKREYGKRFKLYWEKRLDEIGEAPKDNLEETQEFVIWAKDSLLGHKETLDLLHRTLELSNGKSGEYVDSVDLVEGICDAAEGNEVTAIRCLTLAFDDPEMSSYSSIYKKNLAPFFELIIGLPEGYPDIDNIREEGIDLVDKIGRLCADLRDDYSKVYAALNEKIKE